MDIERNLPDRNSEANGPPAAPEIAVRVTNPQGNHDTAKNGEDTARKRKPMTIFEVWVVILTAVAILVAGATGVVLWLTLIEIRNGGTDTHTLAEAAKKQADKAETISSSTQQAAAAMDTSNSQAKDALGKTLRQSKAALDSTIAASRLDQRAWIGSGDLALDSPEVGSVAHAHVTWLNTGKTFAKGVIANTHLTFRQEIVASEFELAKLVDSADSPAQSIGILFPGIRSASVVDAHIPVVEIDGTRIMSDWYTYLWGEVTYFDVFAKPHQTRFCGYRKGMKGDFWQCPFHNDAN